MANSQHLPLLYWLTLGPGYSPLGPRPLRFRLNTFSSCNMVFLDARAVTGSTCDNTSRDKASVVSLPLACCLGIKDDMTYILESFGPLGDVVRSQRFFDLDRSLIGGGRLRLFKDHPLLADRGWGRGLCCFGVVTTHCALCKIMRMGRQ